MSIGTGVSMMGLTVKQTGYFLIITVIFVMLGSVGCTNYYQDRADIEAQNLVRSGRYSEAVEECTRLIEEEGMDSSDPILKLRGTAYIYLGEYDAANADFNRVIERNTLPRWEMMDVYCRRGLTYSEMGEYDPAVEDYSTAIEYGINNAQAYNGRGWALIHLGELERAMEDINRSLEFEPNNNNTLDSRAVCYLEMGEYESGMEDINRAIEINGAVAEHYYHRARIWLALEEYGNAVEDLDMAIRLKPGDREALELLETAEKGLWDELESENAANEDQDGS